MENNQESGISLKELLIYIWKKKIMLLIAFIAITVVSFAAVTVARRTPVKYVSEVIVSFDGMIDNKYPDGSLFSYRDIASKESLTTVKNSNLELYETIDVDSLYDNDGISVVNTNIETNLTNKIFAYTLRVEANSSYFTDVEQARSFITDMIESKTIDRVAEYYNNFKLPSYFANVTDSSEYTFIYNKVAEAINELDSIITQIISKSDSNFIYDEEKTLGDLKHNYDDLVAMINIEAFAKECTSHKRADKNSNDEAKAFETAVIQIMDSINNCASAVEKAYTAVGHETYFLYYDSNKRVTTSGGSSSLVTTAALSVIIGVFGAFAVTWVYGAFTNYEIKGSKKDNKTEEK